MEYKINIPQKDLKHLFDALMLDGTRPTRKQIAKVIKDNILSGVFPENTLMPSLVKMAEGFKISRAPMSEAMNILAREKVLEKKRGYGWLVSCGAVKAIRERECRFFDTFMIPQIVRRAKFLGRDPELLEMIKIELEK